jgi:hypothetical protein
MEGMVKMKVSIVKGIPGVTGKEVTISKAKGGLLKLQTSLLKRAVLIKVDRIEWAEQRSRSLGKAAAGAIMGGLLTGGIGLLAGAAIGGRSKDASTAVLLTDKGEALYLRMKAKEYEVISSWI